VPQIDFAPLDAAAKGLHTSTQAFDAAYAARVASGFKLSAKQSARIDELMGRMEQALTDLNGLPGRDWFKHMIYAPGLLTGYGVKTVPGVREALEARNWQQADQYAAITANVLDGYRAELDKLTALLQANAR
jgi:N-acetylated-alpha-linked acidic dipeptidase